MDRWLIGIVFSVLSAMAPGCTTPIAPSDAGRDAASPGIDAPTGIDAPSGIDAPDPDASVAIDAADGGVDGGALDAPAGGGEGSACGTRGADPCVAGLDCIFAIDAACGASGGGGTCQRRPPVCPDGPPTVCGCDGTTYRNECVAHAAGVSAVSTGDCPATCAGSVACGTLPPRCVAGSVPSIVSACWGPCVPIGNCACTGDRDCPAGMRRCGASGRCEP